MIGLKPTRFTEFSGWYGMSALITAYALVSFGVIDSDGLVYQLLNLSGAAGLLIVAASKGVPQAVLTNVFWALIGIVAIGKILLG